VIKIQKTVEKSLVSVIVLNWNGERFLEDCLVSLLKQDYSNYEVLLVDNGSSDGSLSLVQDMFGKNSKLRIIALKENNGFSKGNNIGTRYTKGKYIIFLNNDTIVEEQFITKLVNVAESNTQIASVGCKILTKSSKTWFSQKFINGGLIVPLFLQNLIRTQVDDISNRYCVNLANSGCVCLFRKEILLRVGGYDEDFWADWEDWDLGYRLNIAGYKSVHIPISLVFHVGGGSFGNSPERYSRIYRNTLFTYFKNYESYNLLTRFFFFAFFLLPLYHLGFIVSQLIVNGRQPRRNEVLGSFLSLANAYVMFLSKLRVFSRKRYSIKKLRQISDKRVFRNTSEKSLL
jgi:GT2 family glycosyltransferase